MTFTIAPMQPADLPAVLALLADAGLPTDGLEAHREHVQVARAGERVVGCVALELYDDGVLLRSLAVAADCRGLGIGFQLTQAALEAARTVGAVAVYLLTETADRFFPRFGFRPIDRQAAPPQVSTSVEFTSVCPDTAIAMALEL